MATAPDKGDDVRSQFGNRFLTDPQNVFQHNAWDNVVWDSEQEDTARRKTQEQASDPLAEDKQELYEEKAGQFWDDFYSQHNNRFFKDRHWLFTEFPELYATSSAITHSKGNSCCSRGQLSGEVTQALPVKDQISDTTLPAVSLSRKQVNEESDRSGCVDSRNELSDCFGNCSLNIQDIKNVPEKGKVGKTSGNACSVTDDNAVDDFPGSSSTFRILEVGCGVGNTVYPVLQTNNDPGLMVYCCDFSPVAVQLVKEHPDYQMSRCHAFVCDITSQESVMPFPENSLDTIIMIFVLSAINPTKMQAAVDRLARHLKPGGRILFRDYGRYDLAQLRFKKGRCLSENFYVRGDGTRVYFFTQDELKDMFTKAGLVEEQNLIDRRLQVNRGKQLKMYRVWIQCKYRKPLLQEEKVENS